VGIVLEPTFVAMDEDPDDYRPSSSWALTVDPDGRAALSVIRERIGVGDRIPRHWHDVDEVVLYEGGSARVHVDGVEHEVSTGATVFIPAGVVHGTLNTGDTPVEIRAVFPSVVVRIDAVERNAAPGTEDDPPRAVTYDMATGGVIVHGETERPKGSP
jgi:quercetin dioxygenase-like cupin family protein